MNQVLNINPKAKLFFLTQNNFQDFCFIIYSNSNHTIKTLLEIHVCFIKILVIRKLFSAIIFYN